MEEELADDINEQKARWKTVNNQKDKKVQFMTQNQNDNKTTMFLSLASTTRNQYYHNIRMDTSEDTDQVTKQYFTAK
eukprot:11122004-Ditylum_brightwellii.AAC.2